MKPLVLCADDYAVHPGASRGIVHLASRGRLSATSVMSLSPHWAEDAAPLRDLRGQIDVGLHLDWTSEFASAAGHGLSLSHLMLRAALGRVNRREARAVIERQLDAFEQHWKAPPDHVDGHQHVQQFAGIREALVEVLAGRYAVQRPYLRVSQVPSAQATLKSRIIAAMGAQALRREALARGLACTLYLSGVYEFTGGEQGYAHRMRGWLANTASGVLMCHPAQEAPSGDVIGAARCWEFAYLESAVFADDLAAAQVQLRRGPG